MNNIKSKIFEYYELIKFEHTIFALPFALSGMLLASLEKFPPASVLMWVLLAMIGGRTAAMSLNRLIDAEIDKKNPRTIDRAIPAGRIEKNSVFIFAMAAFGVMIYAVWQLPLICKQLLPLAIIILIVYSFTKRFTYFSHFVLGGALGASAAGGWLAVSGEFSLPVVLWGISVVFWVAGFDVIYAMQDIDFDRKNKLFSLPSLLGIKNSLLVSRIFHLFTVFFFAILGLVYTVGIFYWIGTVFVSVMLIWEQSLLKENDLSKLNSAFFNINGYVSIGFFKIMNKIFEIIKQTLSYKLIQSLFSELKDWLDIIGIMGINLFLSLKCLFTGKLKLKLFYEQAARFGVDSLPISLLMVGLTGMIIALQIAKEMVKQGAGHYVGMLVSVSIVRELGPVIGGFAVISMVGSSMAAEIATMKVTEQVDAIKALGVNPIHYLIAPRVIAGIMIMPFVIILANTVGIVGGMFMSKLVSELNAENYINSVWIGLSVKDFLVSVFKGSIFGGIIAVSCASIGYRTEGGAIDVGKATTNAVVWSFILMLIADYFISFICF